MIRDFLRQDTPTVAELLRGRHKEIAEATGFNYQVVGRMLRGYRVEDFSDESLATVAEAAAKILKEQAETYKEKARELEMILGSVAGRG